jgi:hypothetical protein
MTAGVLHAKRPPRKRLRPNALVLTGLATFRLVGKPEVILGLDLFGDRVINALLYGVG